ncbi:MAG: replication/maintenance protein RepL [Aliarcobacter butzleri]|nr:replication/maintenance protein RepL [Aliarcobacter butzleri]
MRIGRNIAYEENIVTINQETGEITERKNTKQYKAEVEPSYIKLYIEDIAYFYKLDISSDLMYALLKYVNYQQEIVINKAIKERIADEIGKSLSYINNNITKLVKNEVMIRVNMGVYQLNTYLFGKGNWKDIMKHRKSLELSLFYSYKDGRDILK